MPKENIKIFVSYKDKHRILKSDIITPIQTGRAIAKEKFEGMIGDDTGDNISAQNPKYCELTAMYWVWKHYEEIGNPEYVGFMHYRRQFLFNTSKLKLKKHWHKSFYKFSSFNSKLFNSFSDEEIKKTVYKYDYIVPDWLTPLGNGNIREEYIHLPGSKAEIFDTFIEICKEKAPEYTEEIEKIEHGSKELICNMFIMKKELFFKYCAFAFPILEELVKRIDDKDLSTNGLRFAGYMGEKLVSIFVMNLEKDTSLKEGFLDCSFIEHPDYSAIKEFIRSIFSITDSLDNSRTHKVLTILGLKFKFRVKKNKTK